MSTVLVINYKYKNLDRRKALASATDKTGVLFESKKIPDYKMPAFIASFMQMRSIGIDGKASQMLSDFLGNDLSRLSKELDKLALILPEKGAKRITPELVEQNIGISKEYNNFELIKALAMKDVLKANRIAQYFEKNPKSNPIQMTLPVLFNYFSNLLICYYTKDRSEAGLMTALGLRGTFQVKDYLLGMRNYSAMKVFNLISDIRMTDAIPVRWVERSADSRTTFEGSGKHFCFRCRTFKGIALQNPALKRFLYLIGLKKRLFIWNNRKIEPDKKPLLIVSQSFIVDFTLLRF